MAGEEVVWFPKDRSVRNDGTDKEMTGKRGEMEKGQGRKEDEKGEEKEEKTQTEVGKPHQRTEE